MLSFLAEGRSKADLSAKDASSLLMHHPWPGRKVSDTLDPDAHRHPRRKQRFSLYRIFCGHRLASSSSPDEDDDDALKQQERKIRGIEVPRGVNGEGARTPEATAEEGRWCWTQELMDDFRIEMEKLVILCVVALPGPVAPSLKQAC